MNERKPKWSCPVCNKSALYENLLIDGFFMELLGSSRLPPDEHEIVLHNDGSWDPLPPKREEAPKVNSSRSVPGDDAPSAVETLSVDDDDDSYGSSKPSTSGVKASAVVRKCSDTVDCITLDSDSEDEQPRSSLPPSKRIRCENTAPARSIPNAPLSPDLICLDDD